jgi:hypothetical protein
MNDDEMITLMKEPLSDVHMTMPLDEVVRHGRSVRARRRRLRGLTGAVALAGSSITAVALLVPGGHPAKAQLAAWTVTRDPDGGITVTVNQMKDPAGLQATLRADGIPARVTFDPLNWVTQPLPAGCVAPKMPRQAGAQLVNKIYTPPAIVAYQQQQQEERRLHPQVLHVTYTVNGHVEHTTLLATPGWFQKIQNLAKKEHAEHVRINGFGGALPGRVQKVAEKEEQDPVGRSAIYINPAAIPAGIGVSIIVDVTSPSNFSFGEDLVVASPQCTGS